MKTLLRPLLALAAALLPVPAFADVTATYTIGKTMITVEADNGGDSRIVVGGGKINLTLLHHDGIDYFAMTDRGGTLRVMRTDDFLAVRLGTAPRPPQSQTFMLEVGSDDRVAGYAGTVWRFGPEGETPLEFLMSTDHALAPIGEVFRNLSGLMAKALEPYLGGGGNLDDQLAALFAKGTLLRLDAEGGGNPEQMLVLTSVSMAEIELTHFALPAPVTRAADFIPAPG